MTDSPPPELDRLLLRMIHDLRAPLRQGALHAQMLQRTQAGTLGPEGEAQLSAILEANRDASHFLTRLADYCQAGSAAQRLPPVNPAFLLENALSALEFRGPGLDLAVDRMPDILVPANLQKVFVELLDNARKFRTGPVCVCVSGRSEDGEHIFEIRDDGIGFDANYASSIWEPLERLHGPRDYPGFGLGLAIARRIVGGLGGRAWAQPGAERGSIFSFAVPCS